MTVSEELMKRFVCFLKKLFGGFLAWTLDLLEKS